MQTALAAASLIDTHLALTEGPVSTHDEEHQVGSRDILLGQPLLPLKDHVGACSMHEGGGGRSGIGGGGGLFLTAETFKYHPPALFPPAFMVCSPLLFCPPVVQARPPLPSPEPSPLVPYLACRRCSSPVAVRRAGSAHTARPPAAPIARQGPRHRCTCKQYASVISRPQFYWTGISRLSLDLSSSYLRIEISLVVGRMPSARYFLPSRALMTLLLPLKHKEGEMKGVRSGSQGGGRSPRPPRLPP